MKHMISEEDVAFQQSFELFKVAPVAFDHEAHVRLCYIYLCQYSVDEASQRMKNSLLAFLGHLGVGDSKFHETITRAWVMAVRHFMEESPGTASAHEFVAANPRLLDTSIMLSHYSAEVLYSQHAKSSFVQPDLASIPRHD